MTDTRVDGSSTNLRINTSAPGKVILHGEHSVVYGKLALAASLGLRTHLTLEEMEDDSGGQRTATIELKALKMLHSYKIANINNDLLGQPVPLLKSKSSYNFEKVDLIDHDALLHLAEKFLAKNIGSTPIKFPQSIALISLFYLMSGMLGSVNVQMNSFTLTISTDLTTSAGTGSSASYLVCIAAALLQYIKNKMPEEQDISKPGYKFIKLQDVDVWRFSKNELELISKWAYSAEKILHGNPSGIDNTICTYGSMVEFRKGSPPKLVELACKFRILLINTMMPRDTKTLVSKVATLHENHSAIVQSILDAMNSVSTDAAQSLKNICSLARTNANNKNEFLNSIKQEYTNLQDLAEINQSLLCALGVSHPKLEEICGILREQGLHGKLTGAGGGGYAICLIPPYLNDEFIFHVIDVLTSKGYHTVLTDLGGVGVTIDI